MLYYDLSEDSNVGSLNALMEAIERQSRTPLVFSMEANPQEKTSRRVAPVVHQPSNLPFPRIGLFKQDLSDTPIRQTDWF
jgi:hypothetical protein